MKRIALLLAVILVCGFSQIALASHVGFGITLNGPYGASWDWQGGSRYELWRVLDDAGYSALANDVYLDVNGGAPSSAYSVYKDSYFQFPSFTAELIAEVAGYKDKNRCAWYEKGTSGDVGDTSKTTWGALFEGPDGPGTTVNFANPNEIGFVINPNSITVPTDLHFYTDTGLNGGELLAVTFYLGDYAGYGNEYLVAFEDKNFRMGTDYDYQDMVMHLNPIQPVPEPASLVLLGISLFSCGVLRKKKQL